MERNWIGIAQMARRSGLSQDTLRWYEKEALLPAVPRGTDGRRRYHPQDQARVSLLTALREAGLPTSEMRRFMRLMAEGATSHGRRITLLHSHLERLNEHRARLEEGERRLADKIDHYERLIDQGLDCAGQAVPPELRAVQAARG